jgi:signal transduction histidine kinase
VIVPVLVVLAMQHRERLEEDRQAELRALNMALQQSVREARIATAMAREANRLKSEFLSTMSHELRTPLNAIIGFSDTMMAGMSGPLTEKQQHKLTRINLNSKRLLDLINDLLDLAKIEAGRVEVLHEPFSPAELAASIQAQVESLAEKKGLAFAVAVDPALPPTLVGDAARIDQVARNLLSNAFKFTRAGRVDLRLNRADAETWTLSVVDTGIGIPAHALEFIFDEFRQVDGTSRRSFGGSGLGLAIVRNLSRMMGGEVRVSSVLGEGSTFTVTLPLILPQAEPAEQGATA